MLDPGRARATAVVATPSKPARNWRWHLFRPLAAAMMLGAVAFVASPAMAVDGWIGAPTAADYFRKNLQDSIKSAGEVSKEAGKFESKIESARQAYWLASPDKKDAAAKSFSDLLLSKDLYFATIQVADGINDHSAAVNQMVAALNRGHQLDGGIPPTASPAFLAWVRGLRSSMGARNDNAIVFVEPAAFNKALQDNTDAYDRYRTDRDRAEANKWRSANPPPQEEVGKRPLRGPGKLLSVKSAFPANPRSSHFTDQLSKASAEGANVMRCFYGPSFDAQGTQVYISFDFWIPKAPSNLEVLMALEPAAIDSVADHVVQACPATEADALAVNRVPNKTKVSSQLDRLAMQWKAEERNGPPPSQPRGDTEAGARVREMQLAAHPELRAKVEAIVARNQAAADRREKADKQRACNDQYRLDMAQDRATARTQLTQCFQQAQR